MNEDNVRQNSAKAWLLAARPKTLTAAVIPVVVACAQAWQAGCFRLFPAVVCAVFAGLMQIASNLINDLWDFMKGTDGEDRLGPRRASLEGWVTPTAMRIGIVAVVTLACVFGCLLVSQAGVWLVFLGGACVVFAFLYTMWFSYAGLGDLLVLLFFGLVPVCATYYIFAESLSIPVVICAAACGIVVDTLLVLNNFRDRESDRRCGKRTIIVILGENFGKWLYLALGIAACAATLTLILCRMPFAAILPLLYLVPHTLTWRTMIRINRGRELNRVLGMTSRNMLLYGLLLAAGILLDAQFGVSCLGC